MNKKIFLFFGILGIIMVFGSSRALAQESNPIIEENNKPGTANWQISTSSAAPNYSIAGYITRPSINSGTSVPVHINVKSTEDRIYTVEVYRMGWYGGVGARRIVNPTIYTAGPPQPDAAQVNNITGKVEANWPVGFTLETTDYLTGVYLIRLTDSHGKQAFVPLTIKSNQSTDYLLLSSHLTWQGYSSTGGNSLYERNGDYPNLRTSWCFLVWCQWSWTDPATGQPRTSNTKPVSPKPQANQVTFKRPYPNPGRSGYGSGEFLPYEMPVVMWLEEQGFNVGYAADFDLHEATIPQGVKSVILPAHSEYWTGAMRDNAEESQSRGVGWISFGSNQAYWRGRIEDSSENNVGTYTLYKNTSGEPSSDDPLKDDPALASAMFRSKFVNKPEQMLLGSMFTGWINNNIPSSSTPKVGNGLGWTNSIASNDLSHALFTNTSIAPLEQFTAMTGGEFDKVYTEYPSIPNTIKLFSTQIHPNIWNGGGSAMQLWLCSIKWPNSCYYGNHNVVAAEKIAADQSTTARIFNAGSFSWIWGLENFSLGGTNYNYANQKIRALSRNALLWSAKQDI